MLFLDAQVVEIAGRGEGGTSKSYWMKHIFNIPLLGKPSHKKNGKKKQKICCLKKCVNRDKCVFASKQRMFGVLAPIEILHYRGLPITDPAH